jgi:tetratricopeptide (TPR) repeat protein
MRFHPIQNLAIGAILALALAACSRSPRAREAAHLSKGQQLFEQKDFPRAILEFRGATQAMPRDPEAHYRLGLAYWKTGDVRSAYLSLRKATELNPAHSGAKLKLAELIAARGESAMVGDAVKLAADLVTVPAPVPEAFDALAMAEMRMGKVDDAEKHLREALERFPTHLSASVKLAGARLAHKDWKGAEEVLLRAVAHAPKSAEPSVALGGLYLVEGRLSEAEGRFNAALRIDPANPLALFNLAGIEFREGHNAAAEEHLRLLSMVPNKAYKPLHAVFLFQTGKREAAISELEKLFRDDHSDREAFARLVTAYVASNRTAEAGKLLQSELDKNPKNTTALLLRGRIRLKDRQLDLAEADLTNALSFVNDSAEVHHLLARVYQARGNAGRRKQELAESIRLNPRDVATRIEMVQLLLAMNAAQSAWGVLEETPKEQRLLTPILLQRNWVLLARDQQAEAQKGIEAILAGGRNQEAVLQLATVKFVRKDFDAARELADEALKSRSDDTRALELVFRTYGVRKQLAAGVRKIEEYAARAPESAAVQAFLGSARLAAGDRAGARSAFEAALAADPQNRGIAVTLAEFDMNEGNTDAARRRLSELAGAGETRAMFLLAGLDERAGNMPASVEQYRKLLSIDPSNVAVLNNLAFLMVEYSHQFDEGLKYALQAKELAPENPVVDDTLGWAYFWKGDYQAAVTYLSRSASQAPTARHCYHLAMAKFKTGDRRQGLEMLQSALRLDPNLPEAQSAQRILSQINQ